MFPFVPDIQLFENTPAAAIEQMRERFKLQPGRRRLLFSARMMEVKRPDLAVNAFGRIADERPEWDLVMVGDGPLRIELEASVPPRLRERVIWTGFLNSPEEIAGVYAQCDAMVLPSDHEPWGVVVVEAAAAGLAIVASDNVGAAPELVKPGMNGAVFRAGDLSALTEALREITAAGRVNEAKIQSLAVLHEWLAECDPVAAFRHALREARVMPPTGIEPTVLPENYSIRTEGAAVVPV
jgi:glycosyltransferase involved in cell wall biosynthesis